MNDVIATGRVLEWGNSYGIRVRKSDLERLGLSAGAEVVIRIESRSDRVDLSSLPRFNSGTRDTSERHDEVLAEARFKDLRGKSRRRKS